jgi:hypothetical protein
MAPQGHRNDSLAIMYAKMQEDLSNLKSHEHSRSLSMSRSRKRCKDHSMSESDNIDSDQADELLAGNSEVYHRLAPSISAFKIPKKAHSRPLGQSSPCGGEDGELSDNDVVVPAQDLVNEQFDDLIGEFETHVEVGPQIKQKLVDFIENAQYKPNELKIKEITDRVLKPQNLNVGIERVNSVVWEKISVNTQVTDGRMQGILKKLLPATFLLADTIQQMADAKQLEFVKPLMEVVALLGETQYKAKFIRRNAIQRDLNPKFRTALTSVKEGDDEPKSSKLFGDNLADAVKLIEDSDRLKQNLAKYPVKKPTPYKQSGFRVCRQYQRENYNYKSQTRPQYTGPMYPGYGRNNSNKQSANYRRAAPPARRGAPSRKYQRRYFKTTPHVVLVGMFTWLWPETKEQILAKARVKVKCFKGGQLADHLEYWQTITKNRRVLQDVKGVKPRFYYNLLQYNIVFHSHIPFPLNWGEN